MKDKSIKGLRERLREKDREIVRLLNERAKLAIEVGRVKNEEGIAVYDPAQEGKVYEFITGVNRGPLPDEALKGIFREVISASRALQEPTSVAYLGPEASFCHLAAQAHFGTSASYYPKGRVGEVFDEVERGRIAWGVVPSENSLEGSVKATMDRLITTTLAIRSEIFLRITHCLLSRRTGMDGIRRVYSHPQALAQCQGWLRRHLPHARLIEVESTAAAAKRVLADRKGGVIASRQAAATYGLAVIAEGIEDSPLNTTRFFVIGRGKVGMTGKDKTSIIFATAHVPGALYRALEPFAREGVNLTRIESYPVKEGLWKYLFFVDLIGHIEQEKISACLKEVEKQTTLFKVLGSYPRGEEP